MKKGFKITLISLASLVGLILVAVCVVLFLVFTPARLTSIVKKEIPKFITCDFEMDKAELTFFKTFPKVGVEIQNVRLINPTKGAPSDTLLSVKECLVTLDIREFLRNDSILIHNFYLEDGDANLFVDETGKTNFDVVKTDTTAPPTEFTQSVDLRKVVTDNVNVNYLDLQSRLAANVRNLDLKVKGKYADKNAEGKINLETNELRFKTLDSSNLQAKYDKMKIHFKGSLAQLNTLNGKLKIDLNQLILRMDTSYYLKNADIQLISDFDAKIAQQKINLKKTLLSLNDCDLNLDGTAERDTTSGNIVLNLNYKTGSWQLKKILNLIPKAILGDVLDGLDIDGKIGLTGKISGNYNEKEMPLISANGTIDQGSFAMKDFPLSFQKIDAAFGLLLNLNDKTDLNIKQLSCYTGKNHLTAKGTIKDLLGKMLFNLTATGDLHLPDFKALMPDKLNKCEGDAKATVTAQFDYNQLVNMDLAKMKATGNIQFKNLKALYNDTLGIVTPAMNVDVKWPTEDKPYKINELVEAKIKAPQLKFSKKDLGTFDATDANIHAYLNDLMDSTVELKVGAKFDMGTLNGTVMDTINAQLAHPKGTFVMQNSDKMSLKYDGEALSAQVGKSLSGSTGALTLNATTNYKESEKNALMQWDPTVNLNLKDGRVNVNNLSYPVEIPSINLNFTTEKCSVKESTFKLGNTDFHLHGTLFNMDEFIHDTGLLTGQMEFVSNYTDINQIMDLVSGFRAPDSVIVADKNEEAKEDDPFMVPYGINVRLHTFIKKALVNETIIENIGGHLSVKDGILVLEEMGFTNEAARMQLTAMYKSPRKNHLFVGLDFHLLDIKIDKLIAMIPQIDTLVPMLKSFSGNAEFHLAAETNLKSNYDLKYSTLRGAAAINGHDLVVLDNETYRTIAKKLLFSKNTENKIDSLSVELTAYKNEIDIYPFMVSLDKYQAILSGRHNLDMTCNYDISLLKPLRVGLNISGDFKHLKYKLEKPKYASIFKPERRNVVESNVMELKTLINESLKANVKDQPKMPPVEGTKPEPVGEENKN